MNASENSQCRVRSCQCWRSLPGCLRPLGSRSVPCGSVCALGVRGRGEEAGPSSARGPFSRAGSFPKELLKKHTQLFQFTLLCNLRTIRTSLKKCRTKETLQRDI